MTGAGAPGGPGIIKALHSAEDITLVVADADEQASGRFLNEKFEVVPKAGEERFIREVERICSEHKIEVIFPLVTRELFLLAKHKSRLLKKGIKVIVSNEDGLQIANNKSHLYKHLGENRIPVPEFHVVNTVEEFSNAAQKLGYPSRDFCFKPSVSNGSRGFRIVSARVNEHQLLFQQKPSSTYIGYEKALEILASGSFPELMVMEYLPGEEITVDTIVKNGIPQLILPRRREQMREGISIRGEFVRNEEVISYCDGIIRSMNLHGPIGIQVKQNDRGAYRILEINPRIQGTSVAAMGMGINLPLIAVMQEFDREKELIPLHINWGTKFVRYYSEVFYN
jgi:carbamoyl-phosphate synthase large subunit